MTDAPNATPPRSTAAPESYAVRVTDDRIDVWQYRVSFDEPDGEWLHEESLDRAAAPRLSVESAELCAPSDGAYWLYSRTYACTLECA